MSGNGSVKETAYFLKGAVGTPHHVSHGAWRYDISKQGAGPRRRPFGVVNNQLMALLNHGGCVSTLASSVHWWLRRLVCRLR